MNSKQTKETMLKLRKLLGIFCLLLAPVSVGAGFLNYNANTTDFWHSISATYWATSKPFMIILLGLTGTFFWAYKGYDVFDNMITCISSVCAFGIIFFPCLCSASATTADVLPIPIGISHIIHCTFAGGLFGTFFFMLKFQFKQGDKGHKKKIRNLIYEISADVILIAMCSQVFTSIAGITWMTIVNETVMLTAFGIAWLVKGGFFKRLND